VFERLDRRWIFILVLTCFMTFGLPTDSQFEQETAIAAEDVEKHAPRPTQYTIKRESGKSGAAEGFDVERCRKLLVESGRETDRDLALLLGDQSRDRVLLRCIDR
jgi:hypothetical protein